MLPHPDFAGTTLPRRANLGLFRLAPLDPDATEEDFVAVTRSAHVLQGVFGSDWPLGLTLEENRIDLAWHEREFITGRSFSWILRDGDGAYLGCAYVFPALGERGCGKINLWLVDSPDRIEKLALFQPMLADWLQPFLPAGGHYDWRVNDIVQCPN